VKHLAAKKKYPGYELIQVKLSDLYFNGKPAEEGVKNRAYFERQYKIWENIKERGLENPILIWIDKEGKYVGPPGARLAYAFFNGYDSIDALLIKGSDKEIDKTMIEMSEVHRRTEKYLIDKKYWEKDLDKE
jgi:hypothetical protein